jgi:REP element-mobilizing transposase RayT
MPDHVHLAVKAPTDLSPAQAMKRIKGVSSKLIGDEFVRKAARWTGSAGRRATASLHLALRRRPASSNRTLA